MNQLRNTRLSGRTTAFKVQPVLLIKPDSLNTIRSFRSCFFFSFQRLLLSISRLKCQRVRRAAVLLSVTKPQAQRAVCHVGPKVLSHYEGWLTADADADAFRWTQTDLPVLVTNSTCLSEHSICTNTGVRTGKTVQISASISVSVFPQRLNKHSIPNREGYIKKATSNSIITNQ